MGTKSNIKYEYISGSNRVSNYIFATVLSGAGLAFFLAGISSYFKINLIPFSDLTGIFFLPQGFTLLFYGTAALFLSFFIWITIFLDVGSGLNKYDKEIGEIIISRRGFLGKNRNIELIYSLENVESIKLRSVETFNSTPSIYLCLKDKREIPLTNLSMNPTIREIEERAASLAKFLDVYLDGM